MSGLFALLVLVSSFSIMVADEPSRKISPEEQNALLDNLSELINAGDKAYRTGKYQEAGKAWNEALRIARRLYPKDDYPNGHTYLATSLNLMGILFHKQERPSEAEPFYKEALDLYRRLYPPGKFPNGLRELDNCLTSLVDVLHTQGKYSEEEPLLREAIKIKRSRYPLSEYPNGHADIANNLSNLAVSLEKQAKQAEAERFYRDALVMKRAVYPRVKNSADHADLFFSLKNLALALQKSWKYAESEELFREALSMKRERYPKDSFPMGHADLATSYGDLAAVLEDQGKVAAAEDAYRNAVKMRKSVYEKEMTKWNRQELARELNNLARPLGSQGKSAEAEQCYREAQALMRGLPPGDVARDGQALLASILNNLATTLHHQGKFSEALPLLRESLAMREMLYPKSMFPKGDPDLVGSMNNQALIVMSVAKDYAEAERWLEKTLKMQRALHASGDHPEIASVLNNLSMVLREQNKLQEAEQKGAEAFAMRKRLYQQDKFPDGHTELADSMANLAILLRAQGKTQEAVRVNRDALAMEQRLFPKDRFPDSHPHLVRSLNNLATCLREAHENAEADTVYRAALAANRTLTKSYTRDKPEGEALTLIASAPATRDGFLANARALRSDPAAVYSEIWAEKGLLARLYEQRQQTARAATEDPKAAKMLSELADARRRRAEQLLAPELKDPATRRKRDEEIKDGEKKIAQLDLSIRPLLAGIRRAEKLAISTPSDLRKALPDDAAVVDFLFYWHFEQAERKFGKASEGLTGRYLAFVATRDKIALIDLGPKGPIDAAIGAWRKAILDGNGVPPERPMKVHELIWAKVRTELLPRTKVVYIAPDLALCGVPWAALPGDKPGTILLEDFAVATIPHAAFLLDKLWPQDPLPKRPTEVLVVGGVAYDCDVPASPPALVALNRGAPPFRVGAKIGWPALPATAAEANGVATLAGASHMETRQLRGDRATAADFITWLAKARAAHIATHGFFADASFRSAFQLDPKEFEKGALGERVGRAALSPLVMTGLVFSGANNPATPGRGIVTGEALIDLDLSGLELAVLSACETGLGDVASGEGVFGLQRAFHLAGTRDVVASLWKVSDAPTAALMGEFYRALWTEKLPPVLALQKAQLAVYRADPKQFREMVLRGPGMGDKNFDAAKVIGRLPINPNGKNPPVLWAAFILSGPGR